VLLPLTTSRRAPLKAGGSALRDEASAVRRLRWGATVAAVVALVAIALPVAHAAVAGETDGVQSCPAPDSQWSGSNPWCYDWQTDRDWKQVDVTVPSADDGADLTGRMFRPAVTNGRALPAVVILHGLGGKQSSMWWLGRYLAGRGYVALTVTTAANQAVSFQHAMQAMLDYLRSGSSPYAALIDVTRLGAVGHSAGARAASWIQDADHWSDAAKTMAKPDAVRTIVALDNLTSDLQGDSGVYLLAPQCTASDVAGQPVYTSGVGSTPITPRVPAMGLASDDESVTCPERNVVHDADAKKAAWSTWRAAGIDSLELVLRDANHLSFDQDGSRTVTGDAHLHDAGALTLAWLDRYLQKHPDSSALFGTTLVGQPRAAMLSASFHSGAFVPDLPVDCPQFEDAATCPSSTRR
jgi:predicted dienelactone hydrolase